MQKAKILLISLKVGDLGTRLATELVDRDVPVAAFCHRRHLLSKAKGVRTFRSQWGRSTASSIAHAIRRFRPTALVPCDDDAARALHALHADNPQLHRLIEHSIGHPDSYAVTDSRAAFCEFMAREIPDVMPHEGVYRTLRSLLANLHSPDSVVLKCDGLMSGKGVVMPRSLADVTSFASKVTAPRGRFRSAMNRWLLEPIAGIKSCEYNVDRKAIVVQTRIDGWQANGAAYCADGEVQALTIAEVIAHLPNGGPSTVIRLIDHPQMAQDIRRIASKLRLTGFHGFDFIVDQDGKPWLLENNPRFIPTGHLVGHGGDLIDALCRRAGLPASPRLAHASDMIALFPRELSRDPSRSEYPQAFLDVPKTDNALAQAMLRRASQRDLHGTLLRLTRLPRKLLKARRRRAMAAQFD